MTRKPNGKPNGNPGRRCKVKAVHIGRVAGIMAIIRVFESAPHVDMPPRQYLINGHGLGVPGCTMRGRYPGGGSAWPGKGIGHGYVPE